jgi:hypothetical protein
MLHPFVNAQSWSTCSSHHSSEKRCTVGAEHPYTLNVYVTRIHSILWLQLFTLIVIVTPFTFDPQWKALARHIPVVGFLPMTIVSIASMLIPDAKKVYPGNWINVVLFTITEGLTVGVFAAIADSPVVLYTLLMALFSVTMFLLAHTLRRTVEKQRVFYTHENTISSESTYRSLLATHTRVSMSRVPSRTLTHRVHKTMHRVPYVQTPVAWSPPELLSVGWISLTMSVPLLKATFGPDTRWDVLLWASLFATIFVTYIVAQTYFSTQQFTAEEFVTGTFGLFIGLFSLLLLIVWFTGNLFRVAMRISRDFISTLGEPMKQDSRRVYTSPSE